MSQERRPSLPWIFVAVKPGVSVGTRNAETPRAPGPPVRAMNRHTPAIVPLVMKILVPLSRYRPSGSFSAVAVRSAGFDPWSGSVRPKQPSTSPEAIRGSHCCFCSSVPHRSIEPATRPRCTLTMERTLASPRPSSSMKST